MELTDRQVEDEVCCEVDDEEEGGERRAEGDEVQLRHEAGGLSSSSAGRGAQWRWRGPTRAECFLLRAAVVVGGGGFIFGYNIGVMSGALAQLEDKFDLSSVEVGLVMGALSLGSVLGCVVGGALCDSILGRWKTIQLQNVVFLIGALITVCSSMLSLVIIGRFIVGFASSLSAIADIPYLQEVSPVNMRGRISSSYEMLVVIGILVSFACNIIFTDATPHEGWRYMFLLPTPFLVLQIIGLFTLPESPKYLLDTGQIAAAKSILRLTLGMDKPIDECTSVYLSEEAIQNHLDQVVHDILKLDGSSHVNIDSRFDDDSSGYSLPRKKGIIRRQVDRIKKASSSYSKITPPEIIDETRDHTEIILQPLEGGNNISSIDTFREYRLPLILILSLMVFQQFTGGVVVRNYAPKIFNSAGFGQHRSLLFNIVLGMIKVVSTAVSIFFVDSAGRKILLLVGIIISSTGLLLLSVSFEVGLDSNVGIFLCAGSLITAGYSVGFGPVCWVMQSEYFPTSIRGRCMSMSVLVSNLGQFVMTLMFPPLASTIHPGWIFLSFFIISMFALIFVCACIIETKGKQPKEILGDLRSANNVCFS